jgi:hypothetical protein
VSGGGSGGNRAGVFDDDLGDVRPRPATEPGKVRQVAEAAGFRSREPSHAAAATRHPAAPAAAGKREPRRYRTGRNQQLNIKATPEAIESFYAVAERQGWVLGETFERAIAALLRELDDEGNQIATR